MVGYPNSHDISVGTPMLNPVSCCSPSSSLKMQRANGTCDAPDFGHSLLLFFGMIEWYDTPMTHAILVKLVYLKGMKHWHCRSKHWRNNFETSMLFSWLNHPHVASCILTTNKGQKHTNSYKVARSFIGHTWRKVRNVRYKYFSMFICVYTLA